MSALSAHEFIELYTRQYQNCLVVDVQSPLGILKLSGAIKRSQLGRYLNWDQLDHSIISELLLSLSDCRTVTVNYIIFYDESGHTSGIAAKLALLMDHYSIKQGCFITGGIDAIQKEYPHVVDNPNSLNKDIQELRKQQQDLIQQVWYPLKSTIRDYPRHVIDHIYLSGKDGASFNNLSKYKIDVVIRIGFFDEMLDNCEYHSYPLEDASHERIESIFEETSNILHQCHLHNKRVLVHCHAGVSRSSTIILYYMMKYLNYSLKDAFDVCFKKRPIVRPNEGFAKTLQEFEVRMNKTLKQPTIDVCYMSYDYNIYREYLEFKMRMNAVVDEAVDF